MRHFILLLCLAGFLTLSGCGGGGGSDSPAPVADNGDSNTPPPPPDDGGDDPEPPAPPPSSNVQAGVAVVDMTPNVGYCNGQYCGTNEGVLLELLNGGSVDPFLQNKSKQDSEGVQSRLTARAIVVEGANGRRIALVKTDNYLAQDMLMRRVGQILDQGDSGVGYEQIMHHVTHNHTSSYSSTLAAGVWLFQDVWDFRFFEYQARRIAEAIEQAAASMRPARMGATTVEHHLFKGNVTRLATADDGTPAGYPLEYGDKGLVVMRFDAINEAGDGWEPLAVWMNWGEHPESLDGSGDDEGAVLHSADFVAPLERFIEQDLGVPLVFSQGDVGSAESSGNTCELLDGAGNVIADTTESLSGSGRHNCAGAAADSGVWRDWNHAGFVQFERNVRYLADAVVEGFVRIGAGDAQVPMSNDFPVDFRSTFVPGPASHPFPTVSNCNSDSTVQGDVGVPALGLPDCAREGVPGANPVNMALHQFYLQAKANGVPVPDQYSAPSFGVVQENNRIYLQTMRLGEVLLASCACEAQMDLILNMETRADRVQGNIYDGFDWACLEDSDGDGLADRYKNNPDDLWAEACAIQEQYYDVARFPTPIPGDNFGEEAIAHMRAQLHNDAAGWDAPENAASAGTEPSDNEAIWGNFTKEEIQERGVAGYTLPVGVGHAGDYNGYTVSYREYMNRDHYRKALTTYGPHTADYMVTRLVRMAGAMQGGPELAPEPHDSLAQVDEARQQSTAIALGQATSGAYDAWRTGLPNDAGPAAVCSDETCGLDGQPADISHFQAATFSWVGGNNAVDNPVVRVERLVDGEWQPFADMSGDVQTQVQLPEGIEGVVETYAGQRQWQWTANFEAFAAFPRRFGTTPFGRYRFVADGQIRQAFETVAYQVVSEPFTVSPWGGIEVADPAVSGGDVSFSIAGIVYPASYEEQAALRYISADGADGRICERCSFRPWARIGEVETATVTVTRADGNTEQVAAGPLGNGRWQADTNLEPGDSARLPAGGVVDSYGEINSEGLAFE